MGNLFSSDDNDVQRESAGTSAWQQQWQWQQQLELQRQQDEEQARLRERMRMRRLEEERQRQEEVQRARREAEELARFFETLNISTTSSRHITVGDLNLLRDLLAVTGPQSWSPYVNAADPYLLLPLDEHSSEYITVERSFSSTNKKCFHIREIKEIVNPFLLMQYELRKEQCKRRYGDTSEMQLFHGTREDNIDSICRDNFDWRRRGEARGHIFGQGVSFTPIANYATHYGDKTYDKVMILANVIVSSTCIGNKDTVLPEESCDTTTKEDKHVYVKYDDNTFYPAYVIYYGGFDPDANTKKMPKPSVRETAPFFYD